MRACFIAASALALATCAQPAPARTPAPLPPARTCVQPVALDGDTIRCANLAASVRLIGIDAPELPGHCRRGRTCAPGDPYASRHALEVLLQSGPVRVRVLGQDLYRRNLGLVTAGKVNLSCAQLANDHAIFKPNWNPHHLIAAACGREVQ